MVSSLATRPSTKAKAAGGRHNGDIAEADLPAEALLIRAFVQDVHTGAVLTAAAASAVNFARGAGAVRALQEARNVIAGFAAQSEHWPRRILEQELSAAAMAQVEDFYQAFRRGRTGFVDYEVDSDEIGAERAAPLHTFRLASDWQRTARLAAAALLALHKDARVILPEDYIGSGEILAGILRRVSEGMPECCRDDGSIILPQLAERRRAPRQSLLQAARVRSEDGEFPAFARDISSGGVGLTGVPPMTVGTALEVDLACGRSFRGTIAWSKGADAGMIFDRPLLPTDPLIFG